jgi:hypothetical protein
MGSMCVNGWVGHGEGGVLPMLVLVMSFPLASFMCC